MVPPVQLADPTWLALLVFVPLPFLRQKGRPRLRWPTLKGFAKAPRGWARWRFLPPLLKSLAIACLAVALARPQTVGGQVKVAGRGVAIVVAIDRSRSMLAEDFVDEWGKTTRLEAAKSTFVRFVEGRPDDLIGLVAFARNPDRRSAPTLDHRHLIGVARSIRPAEPGENSTNIGHAVVFALGDAKAAPSRKRVVVLLTDGEDRPGVAHPIDPLKAAELARDLGITLHTIAVGRASGQVRQREGRTGLDLVGETDGPNVALLEEMARTAGGRSFAATDAEGLAGVFEEIDRLEKSEVRGAVWTRYREEYAPWVLAALGLLAADRWLAAGRLRRLP